MQAKAAVHYEGTRAVEIEQLEVLPPREEEVAVRYVASGVCHSDLHHIQGRVAHPTPVVYGHEGAGIIEQVGPNVTSVKPGDHVLTSYIASCGRCHYCTIGRGNLCDLRDKPQVARDQLVRRRLVAVVGPSLRQRKLLARRQHRELADVLQIPG